MIRKADKSAQKLVEILVEEFPSLRDVAEFDGKKGKSYRKSQTFIMWLVPIL